MPKTWRRVLVPLVCLVPIPVLAQDIVAMIKMAKPSVVTVVPLNTFGLEDGYGSGFFIDSNRVVTNEHVIRGASGVKLLDKDSVEYFCTHIVAMDSARDLAILEVEIPSTVKINPLQLKAQIPEQGEKVYVVGNPLGFQQSVSDGIVASIRSVEDYGKMIQFTAAISPGNSGSPLLDANGAVLGVAAQVYEGGQNVNFAIPTAAIKELVIGDPIPFKSDEKEYDGVLMKVVDAFSVDTTLRGVPPAHLSQEEKNEWRIMTAGLRYRWDSAVVSKHMKRIMRGVKRNYPKFDFATDTLTMSQAMSLVSESLGLNPASEEYPPKIQGTLAGIRYGLEVMSQSMLISGKAIPVATAAGTIEVRAQIWVELQKDADYAVLALADTATITDIDIAVFRFEDGKWKPVASNTDEEPYAVAAFTAPETDEYAFVWRVAKKPEDIVEGVFGSIVIATAE